MNTLMFSFVKGLPSNGGGCFQDRVTIPKPSNVPPWNDSRRAYDQAQHVETIHDIFSRLLVSDGRGILWIATSVVVSIVSSYGALWVTARIIHIYICIYVRNRKIRTHTSNSTTKNKRQQSHEVIRMVWWMHYLLLTCMPSSGSHAFRQRCSRGRLSSPPRVTRLSTFSRFIRLDSAVNQLGIGH